MTLRTDIERAKTYLANGSFARCKATLETILDEMQEEKQPSIVGVRKEILKKLRKEVDDNCAGGAHEWAEVLAMLPE